MVLINSNEKPKNDRHIQIFNSLFSLIDFRLMNDSFKCLRLLRVLLFFLCSGSVCLRLSPYSVTVFLKFSNDSDSFRMACGRKGCGGGVGER